MSELSQSLDRNPDVCHSPGSALRTGSFPSGKAERSVKILVADNDRPVAADRRHMKSRL